MVMDQPVMEDRFGQFEDGFIVIEGGLVEVWEGCDREGGEDEVHFLGAAIL